MKNPITWLAAALFIAAVLAANYLTTEYGLIAVGFGLTATAGTYAAGLTFVVRDTVQDAGGRTFVFAIILAAALLSYLIADPFIATASGVAFAASELADLAVYTPLRKRGYVRAAVASNVVGIIVDTFLFLWIAGFAITGQVVAGQGVAKITVTAAVIVGVLATRAVLRQPNRV